jgi:cytoskeletal protein RodZ
VLKIPSSRRSISVAGALSDARDDDFNRSCVELERNHFGTYLRKHREARALTLGDLSRTTRIKESCLALLEAARLEALPARVFVVGWITAYARAVGCDPAEALILLGPPQSLPAATDLSSCVNKLVARAPEGDEPGLTGRRISIGLVVLVLLIVATLTLSLLLGRGSQLNAALVSASPTAVAGE